MTAALAGWREATAWRRPAGTVPAYALQRKSAAARRRRSRTAALLRRRRDGATSAGGRRRHEQEPTRRLADKEAKERDGQTQQRRAQRALPQVVGEKRRHLVQPARKKSQEKKR